MTERPTKEIGAMTESMITNVLLGAILVVVTLKLNQIKRLLELRGRD